MVEVIFIIFLFCLGAISLFEILKILSTSFFYKKKIFDNSIFLIPLYGHNEEIEMVLRNAVSNIKWFENSTNRKIVCLDIGMDHETRQICEIISEENSLVEIYSLEEFNIIMKDYSNL